MIKFNDQYFKWEVLKWTVENLTEKNWWVKFGNIDSLIRLENLIDWISRKIKMSHCTWKMEYSNLCLILSYKTLCCWNISEQGIILLNRVIFFYIIYWKCQRFQFGPINKLTVKLIKLHYSKWKNTIKHFFKSQKYHSIHSKSIDKQGNTIYFEFSFFWA